MNERFLFIKQGKRICLTFLNGRKRSKDVKRENKINREQNKKESF